MKLSRILTAALPPAALALAVALAGCGRGKQPQALELKYPNVTARTVELASGYAVPQTMTFTSREGKITTASSYNIHLANFPLDATQNGRKLNNLLGRDEQVKVFITLIGEEGDIDSSPPRTGSHSPKADKFRKVRIMTISTRAGGKGEEFSLRPEQTAGEVKVTSVRNDTIDGQIDLVDGGMAIKGPFSAKIVRAGK